MGRAEIHENDAEATALIEKLRVPGEKSIAERAVIIHVEAFDWNCPQHITPRFTVEQIQEAVAGYEQRIGELEQENRSLREMAEKSR